MRSQSLLLVPTETRGYVNPELHGAFAEHLGESIYPGLWCGEHSQLTRHGGLRSDVLEALRPLALPVLRWPGGNFADSYRFRDGIGPASARPLRVNTQWGNAEEPNHFGTHEFIRLCRELGAEPYFAANIGSEPPSLLKDWVEYCNFAGPSALARERQENGASAPFAVRYWGIGNETWGAGGNMGPEHYAAEFCRYRTYLHEYSGHRPFAIAAGPNAGDFDWTRRFFEYVAQHHSNRLASVDGFSIHHYTWNSERDALDLDAANWLGTLSLAWGMDGLIEGHRLLMDHVDPLRQVALVVDEWGIWHKPQAGKPASSLYQQNTVRDAVVAAITLDVFNRRAALLKMANLAQVVNVLQALVLADKTRCFTTPTFHVFDLYRPHRGGSALRCENLSDVISDGGEATAACRRLRLDSQAPELRHVLGSATSKQGIVTITAVNTHPEQTCELVIAAHRAQLGDGELVQLSFDGISSHNTFDEPARVGLTEPARLSVAGGQFRVELRPGAVVRVQAPLRAAP